MSDHTNETGPGSARDAHTARDAQRSDGDPSRTDLPQPDRQADTRTDEPRSIDLGARSFANTNVAADETRQARERGAGLGAGSSATRDGEADGGGDVPEDDLD